MMSYRDIRQLQKILLIRKFVAYLIILKYFRNLIEEYDESGQVNSDYIYFGSVPIARVDEWWEGIETPEAPAGVTVTPGDTQLTVSWDANDEPVDGYKVHYGTQSKNYTTSVDVGKVTSHTITDLINGTTYYVAVTAYADLKETYYYHTDHLGTPIMMTDKQGNKVWEGEFLPFGEEYSVTGTITNNLRFPGQYYDNETGLSQNGRRDYRAEIGGRYIERDPAGLNAGINLYFYANENPVRYSDPSGLVVKLCKRDLSGIPYSPYLLGEEYHHEFIWINGKTFGLTTHNPRITKRCGIEGPGFIEPDYPADIKASTLIGYMHSSCEEVKCDNEENLLKHAMEDKAPYYCLSYRNFYNLGISETIGMNCQDWANMMIGKHCTCGR